MCCKKNTWLKQWQIDVSKIWYIYISLCNIITPLEKIQKTHTHVDLTSTILIYYRSRAYFLMNVWNVSNLVKSHCLIYLYCYKLLWKLSEGKQNPQAQQTANCHIIAASMWAHTQSKFPSHDRKHNFHVTLADASGVSKYQTKPPIAPTLLYLKDSEIFPACR